MPKDDNPGHGKGLVSTQFCNERTRRIEEKIEGMEARILNAINKKNGLSWQAKATIIGSFVMGLSSVLVAVIYVCG